MRLCACVCTYNRPHLLPRVIACFNEQDHEDRCMFIYDDGGQYESQWINERCYLYSTPIREPSLGTKRNRCLQHARQRFGAFDAFLPTDDDDMFLPHHLSASAAALEKADWSRPSQVLVPQVSGDFWMFAPTYTGRREDQRMQRLFAPAHAMRYEAYLRVGGYPDDLSGPEDQALMHKLERCEATIADQIELGFAPSYIYCWGSGNISGLLCQEDKTGEKAWQKLCRDLQPAKLAEWKPPFDLHFPVVANFVQHRQF
jgi:glycosyltransferase involved in cell wall biosynthesis